MNKLAFDFQGAAPIEADAACGLDPASVSAAQSAPVASPFFQHMHPGVLGIMAGCFVFMMVVFWLTFRGQSEATFMVVISAVYLAMYIGTPLVMKRTREAQYGAEQHETDFASFLQGRMDTFTGSLTGWEVLMQACSIPVALALATFGICVAIAMS